MSPTPVTTDDRVSPRIFKNGFLEFFSHIHPATPVVFFSPIVVYFFLRSIGTLGFPMTFVSFVLGVLSWTFVEYAAHRFVFHFEPESKLGKRLHFLLHGVHHDYPNDGTRLVLPLIVSVPLSFGFFVLYTAVFGEFSSAIYAGLITGYVAYDSMHFAIHHFPMKNPVARYLKIYHLKHHFQNPDKAFGVSNPLWDYVFRTQPQAKAVIVPNIPFVSNSEKKAA